MVASKSGITIRRIVRANQNTLNDINVLLCQWKKDAGITPSYFALFIKKSYLIGLFDGSQLVGMVTLVPAFKVSGRKGFVEHLIVDEKYRGRHLGQALMQQAIKLAKSLDMDTLFLTCEPERIGAAALYKKLGFEIKQINFYALRI